MIRRHISISFLVRLAYNSKNTALTKYPGLLVNLNFLRNIVNPNFPRNIVNLKIDDVGSSEFIKQLARFA